MLKETKNLKVFHKQNNLLLGSVVEWLARRVCDTLRDFPLLGGLGKQF